MKRFHQIIHRDRAQKHPHSPDHTACFLFHRASSYYFIFLRYAVFPHYNTLQKKCNLKRTLLRLFTLHLLPVFQLFFPLCKGIIHVFDIIILAVASAVAVSRAVDLRQMGTLCRSTVYLSDRLCKCLCQRRSASKRFF